MWRWVLFQTLSSAIRQCREAHANPQLVLVALWMVGMGTNCNPPHGGLSANRGIIESPRLEKTYKITQSNCLPITISSHCTMSLNTTSNRSLNAASSSTHPSVLLTPSPLPLGNSGPTPKSHFSLWFSRFTPSTELQPANYCDHHQSEW